MAVTTVQDMMFVYCVIMSLGLMVRLSRKLEPDNSIAVDLANSLSVSGCTRHGDNRINYLQEMKKQGYVKTIHQLGTIEKAYIFTKNNVLATFDNHVTKYLGVDDKYLREMSKPVET